MLYCVYSLIISSSDTFMVYYHHVVYHIDHRAKRRELENHARPHPCAAVEQASRTAVVLDIDSQATACKWSARRAADTPLVLAVQPARLPGALATTAAHDVDVVVIDTPARSEHAALEAARVADGVYVLQTSSETMPPWFKYTMLYVVL